QGSFPQARHADGRGLKMLMTGMKDGKLVITDVALFRRAKDGEVGQPGSLPPSDDGCAVLRPAGNHHALVKGRGVKHFGRRIIRVTNDGYRRIDRASLQPG